MQSSAVAAWFLSALQTDCTCFVDPLGVDNWKKMTPLEDPERSLPFIKDILGSLRGEIDAETTLLGFVGSPWTLAAYSCEGKADRHCKRTKVLCPPS